MRLIASCTPAAVPISVCTNRATACPFGSGERAVVATQAPLRVKRRTIACPMPFVPPVTRTRLPLNSSPETGKGYVIVMIESPVKQSCYSLHDSRAVARLRHSPRQVLSGLSTSDDKDLEAFYHPPPCLSNGSATAIDGDLCP